MKTQCYDIVVASRYSLVADESTDETFRLCFPKGTRSRQIHEAHNSKLVIFRVEAKQINKDQVKKFENFLITSGFSKLFSIVYAENMSELDARFFTIRLNSKNFSDMKDLLISKLENAIGRKLQVFNDEIYYFHLTKTQIKSRSLVRLVDDLMFFPSIKIIICI